MANKRKCRSMSIRGRVGLGWECIILIRVLRCLRIAVFSMLLPGSIRFILPPKILSWRSMMASLRIFFRKFMRGSIRLNSRPRKYGINIGLLMIWLHIWWRLKEALFGLVKIMMEMSKVIVLPKVVNFFYHRLWISWTYDICLDSSWWICRIRGSSRNSNKTLSYVSKRKINFNQFDSKYLCLDKRSSPQS